MKKRTHTNLQMGDSAALWAAAKAGNEAEVEDILTNKQVDVNFEWEENCGPQAGFPFGHLTILSIF